MEQRYKKALEAFNIKFDDNYIEISENSYVVASYPNLRKLFNILTEFSISEIDKIKLMQYYGLDQEAPATLSQLSAIYSISDERVRQQLKQSSRKVSHHLNKTRSLYRLVGEVDLRDTLVKRQI